MTAAVVTCDSRETTSRWSTDSCGASSASELRPEGHAGLAALPKAVLKRPSSSCSVSSTTSTTCPTSRAPRSEPAFERSARIEDDFEISGVVLGTGVSGAVRQALCRRTGATYAVKSLETTRAPQKQIDNLVREVDVHSSVDHPGLVRLEAVYETDSRVDLVMEELNGGELFEQLLEGGAFSEERAAGVAVQLLQAVAYLHAHGLVHRDLKPENIMFAEKGSDEVKIIDFGFACRKMPNELLMQRCGTIQYVAPEVLRSSGYGEKCDLWSIGSTIYTLLTMKAMYCGSPAEIQRKNRMGAIDFSRCFKAVSPEGQDFILSLLTVDPSRRPSALQALQHPWLKHRVPEAAAAALAEALCEAADAAPLSPREPLRRHAVAEVAAAPARQPSRPSVAAAAPVHQAQAKAAAPPVSCFAALLAPFSRR